MNQHRHSVYTPGRYIVSLKIDFDDCKRDENVDIGE